MKNKTKALVAVLALSLLLPACNQTDTPSTTTTQPVSTTEPAVVTTAAPEDVFEPTGEKYNTTFNLLVGGNTGSADRAFQDFSEMDASERNVLDEAIYRKNAAVEELYGIELNVMADTGSKSQVLVKLQTAYNSGSPDYDAAIVSAYDAIPLATGGCLYELGSLDTINLDNSWWDQRANTDLKIHDMMFFTTGDITYWDDTQQNAVSFNKQVKEDLNITDDFYQLVKDGEWTLEALAKYAKLATEDLNADNVMDMEDKFGIITWDDSVYAVLNGGGEHVVTREDDGSLTLTLTGSEKIVDLMSKYTDICFGGDAINYQRYTSTGAINMFSTNRALFFLGRMSTLDHFRDMETDYGILPYPKYDSAQEEYHTMSSPYHSTFFCVPASAIDPEMSGAVLEAYAYYGKEYMTPAYYEKTLTGQYFRDEDSLEMLELMAETRSYDIGFYVQPANINKELIFLFRKGSKDFASTFESYREAANAALVALDESYEELASMWDK